MKYSLKPLSAQMIEQLLDARSAEISSGEKHIPISHFKHTLQSLYRRGFLQFEDKMVHGKRQMSVVITEEGNSFLDHYKGSGFSLTTGISERNYHNTL